MATTPSGYTLYSTLSKDTKRAMDRVKALLTRLQDQPGWGDVETQTGKQYDYINSTFKFCSEVKTRLMTYQSKSTELDEPEENAIMDKVVKALKVVKQLLDTCLSGVAARLTWLWQEGKKIVARNWDSSVEWAKYNWKNFSFYDFATGILSTIKSTAHTHANTLFLAASGFLGSKILGGCATAVVLGVASPVALVCTKVAGLAMLVVPALVFVYKFFQFFWLSAEIPSEMILPEKTRRQEFEDIVKDLDELAEVPPTQLVEGLDTLTSSLRGLLHEEDCVICKVPVDFEQTGDEAPCRAPGCTGLHLMHRSCWQTWLNRHPERSACPVCRV